MKNETAANELIQLNKKILANLSYSFQVSYASFKDHSESKEYENLSGIVVKDGLNLYSRVGGATTIQNKEIRIIIDSAKKFIKITNPLEGQEVNFNINDYIKSLLLCKAVKRKEVNEVVAYRFETKGEKGIVAQEIYLGPQFLEKSVIYYINEYNTRENNKIISQTVYPRLEIKITDFKKIEKVNQKYFKTDDIIQITRKGIELKGLYKTFKYFDGRFKK